MSEASYIQALNNTGTGYKLFYMWLTLFYTKNLQTFFMISKILSWSIIYSPKLCLIVQLVIYRANKKLFENLKLR